MRRLSALALFLALSALPARAQVTASPDSACTYETCALRIESGVWGLRLVRGRAGARVSDIGLFGANLPGAVSSSPEALAHARTSTRLRWRSGLATAGAVLAVVAADQYTVSDEAQAGFLVVGLGLVVASVDAAIRAQREQARAVWEYNGSLPR